MLNVSMPGAMPERVCLSCDFFRPLSRDGYGECRRGWPGRRGWPRVQASDFCGCYTAQEGRQNG